MGRCKKGQTSVGTLFLYPSRANWKNEKQVELFINLCVVEVRRYGTKGGSLHTHSWNSIKKGLEEKKVFTFSIEQLKDQWNVLKSIYKLWLDLIDSGSDFKNWSYKKWNAYLKKNQGAKPFRERRLPHKKKMELLFNTIETKSEDSMESSQMDTDVNDSPVPPSPNETSLPNGEGDGENHHSSEKGLALLPSNGQASTHFVDANAPVESSQLKNSTNDSPKSSPDKTSLPNEIVRSPSYAPVESSQMKIHTNSISSQASSKEEASPPNDTAHKKKSLMDFNEQMPVRGTLLYQFPTRPDWKSQTLVELFLDLCIDEVRLYGKNGDSLHTRSWNNIQKILEQKRIFTFNILELRYRWHVLKSSYKVWSDLLDSATDYESNHFNWSTKKWNEYVKKNRSAEQFHGRKLLHVEKMKILFDNIETESDETSQMNTDANDSHEPPSPIGEGDGENHHSNEDGSSSLPCNGQASTHFINANTMESSKMKKGTNDKSPKSTPVEITPLNEIIGSPSYAPVESPQMKTHTDSINSKASSLPNGATHKEKRSMDFSKQFERLHKIMKRTYAATIEECNTVLDGTKELEMGGTLYVAACTIFCESQVYREQWMMLSKKPEEVRINWILMVAKKLGLV